MTKMGSLKKYFIFLIVVFNIGCASILISKSDLKIENNYSRKNILFCVEKWSLTYRHSTTSERAPSPTNQISIEENPDQLLESFKKAWSNQIVEDQNCKVKKKIFIEVEDVGISENQGLFLLSFLTVGIIPSWSHRKQTISISIQDKFDPKQVMYVSNTEYSIYYSIFLWVVSPFGYDSGTFDLVRSTAPKAIQSFENAISGTMEKP